MFISFDLQKKPCTSHLPLKARGGRKGKHFFIHPSLRRNNHDNDVIFSLNYKDGTTWTTEKFFTEKYIFMFMVKNEKRKLNIAIAYSLTLNLVNSNIIVPGQRSLAMQWFTVYSKQERRGS